MALVVEDGTGLATAESYITVAAADTYFSDRAVTAWAALTTANKEANLRKGTEAMTQFYRLRWKGYRGSATQALDWPRGLVERPDYAYAGINGYTTISGDYYFASDEVPVEVQRACAELALKASTTTLFEDQGVPVIREKVGPIETEYARGVTQGARYVAIDAMLAPFLRVRSGFLAVERA